MKYLFLLFFIVSPVFAWEFSYDFSVEPTPDPSPFFGRKVDIETSEGFLTYASSRNTHRQALIFRMNEGELTPVVDLTRFLSATQTKDCYSLSIHVGKNVAVLACPYDLHFFSRRGDVFRPEASIRAAMNAGTDLKLFNDTFYLTANNTLMGYSNASGSWQGTPVIASKLKIVSFAHLGSDRVLLITEEARNKRRLQLFSLKDGSGKMIQELRIDNGSSSAKIFTDGQMVVVPNHSQNRPLWEIYTLAGDKIVPVQKIGPGDSPFAETAKAYLHKDELVIAYPRSYGVNRLRDSGELEIYKLKEGRYEISQRLLPDLWEKPELYFGADLVFAEGKLYCLAPGFQDPSGSGDLVTRILVYEK